MTHLTTREALGVSTLKDGTRAKPKMHTAAPSARWLLACRCVSRRCVEALLALSPHARSAHSPLTFLKYNVEGDLLMTCAKDHTPNLWYADDGERIGTYSGHNGAVWTCDLTGAWPAGAVGLRAVR